MYIYLPTGLDFLVTIEPQIDTRITINPVKSIHVAGSCFCIEQSRDVLEMYFHWTFLNLLMMQVQEEHWFTIGNATTELSSHVNVPLMMLLMVLTEPPLMFTICITLSRTCTEHKDKYGVTANSKRIVFSHNGVNFIVAR